MSDLISRQMAKDEVAEKVFHNLTDEFYGVMQVLDELPSAQQKGKWIFNPSDAIEAMFTKPKCSECGFESADGGNYCPNCGASMVRGEENDE